MPSESTKKKLKAFQFVSGNPSTSALPVALEVNKENHLPIEMSGKQNVIVREVQGASVSADSDENTTLNKSNIPSTPMNQVRLPLQHLLANVGPKIVEPTLSPHLQGVGWKQPTPPQVTGVPGKTPRIARKRARSSSPPGSIEAGQKIKTPRQDPAAEVWSRFRGDAKLNDSTIRASQDGLEALMLISSPRSSETAGSVGGLRRYNSCGLQFPKSLKRRKLVNPGGSVGNVVVEEDESETDCKPQQRISKIGQFLQAAHRMKIQQQQLATEEADASRSTPPQITEDQTSQPKFEGESPLRYRGLGTDLRQVSKVDFALPAVREESKDGECQQQLMAEDELQPDSIGQHSPQQHGESRQCRNDSAPLEPNMSCVPGVKNLDPTSDHEFSDMEFDEDDLDEFLKPVPVPPVRNQAHTDQLVSHANCTQHSVECIRPTHYTDCNDEQIGGSGAALVRQADDHAEDEFGDDFSDDAWDQVAASIVMSPQKPLLDTSLVKSRTQGDAHVVIDDRGGDIDEFGTDDFDEADFLKAEALCKGTNSERQKLAIQRYQVKTVHEGHYSNEKNQTQPEKIIVVEQEKTSKIKYVVLRQAWYETQCTSGSFVHIFGDFDLANQCIVDNTKNMIILHPDHLVSATVVADSFGCIRRAVLQDRVKATGSASAPMLYGNILHELCQEALKMNRWDMENLHHMLQSILPRHYETMVEIGLNLNQAHEFLTPKMLEMSSWAAKFVRSSPALDATVTSRSGTAARMSINKLLDVEEHVWSPNYGLKGNIDATVQINIEEDGKSRTLTVPFEIKTGKRVSESHQAQTALYTLLISDRYDLDVTHGILYYLESSKTISVKAIRHELIHMIMKRNELACYIRERKQLPPMLETGRQRLCNGCYAQTTCHLYHKLSEGGDGTLLEKKDKFQALVTPLKTIHSEFFQKWDSLITKEESEMMKFRRELWTMVSSEREKVNRCFGNLIIMPESKAEDNNAASKINRFQYTFAKRTPKPGFSFTESQLTAGEPIVVSDEQGHFALANGYVTTVHRSSITVAVDRRLHNARKRKTGFCAQNNQSFGGIMELEPQSRVTSSSEKDTILYRLDKDEFSNGMATARNNMVQIMDDSIFKAAGLRSMIIEDKEPVFAQSASGWALPSQAQVGEMNSDQKAAVEKVMTAKDYALVLGMPGTGKTTTIAQIIRSLVAKGKTVLLTSYTHTAVDNILIKLRHAKIDVLRLGVLSKIHPEVREFAILGSEQRESLEEVHNAWHKPPVVATTCLGINHSLFTQRTFDYCIVDEASQITLPVCLGPIRMANTFILVGDHYQLPPIVQNSEALEGGLDMSLFRLLCEKHPQAVVSLAHQYRMCSDIMLIANKLIYSGRLKCGNESVATRELELPQAAEALSIPHTSTSAFRPSATQQPTYICPSASFAACWLSPLLKPSNHVLFLNTDSIGAVGEEISRGNRTTNPLEGLLVTQITHLLVNAGLPSSDLGIVTFYRSQLALLRQSLRQYASLELHTADKFQGRDKEAIIVSFVRNNSDGNVGELLQDWRRINVAVTRARSKLILVGSAKTLAAGPEVLKGLIELCREKMWIHDLPEGTAEMHITPDLNYTQSGSAGGTTNRALEAFIDLTSPRSHKSKSSSHTDREPLKELSTNTASAPRLKKMKIPAKIGGFSERVVASKPLMRDIMNDIIGA